MGQTFKIVFAAACVFLGGPLFCAQVLGQALPDGKGKAEFVHNCTACHRADMVTAVRKTPEGWRKSVDEMAARGTDGSKEDLDNVVLYLVKNYSLVKSAPAQTPPAPSGPAVLKLSDVEGAERFVTKDECLTCARNGQQGSFFQPLLREEQTQQKADVRGANAANRRPAPRLSNSTSVHSSESGVDGKHLNGLVRYLLSLPASS